MKQVILHHYDFSNYAEKVRLVLGYKGLTWHSVTIPAVAPKPDLQALTGGYRRTPVLQIGADIYCDTHMILRALEHLQPVPTLYPSACAAHADAMAYWAETQLFRPISLYVSGSNPEVFPISLQADRALMRGLPPPSAQAMAQAASRNGPLVRVQLPVIEDMLADGRQWILGSDTSTADFSIYHALWFITARTQRLAHEMAPFERVRDWMARMSAFGHGERLDMEAATALEVASARGPEPSGDSQPLVGDPPLGSAVRIRASDYGRDVVEGELVFIGRHEIALRRTDVALGDLVVHFPRLGYDLRQASRA
jgi:glutathione S-transferase